MPALSLLQGLQAGAAEQHRKVRWCPCTRSVGCTACPSCYEISGQPRRPL